MKNATAISRAMLDWGKMPRMTAGTSKLARRMLRTGEALAGHLPKGIAGSPGLTILLALHVAEEEARYLSVGELVPAESESDRATRRWIAYLEQLGLTEKRDDVLALTSKGHVTVTAAIEAVFTVQQEID